MGSNNVRERAFELVGEIIYLADLKGRYAFGPLGPESDWKPNSHKLYNLVDDLTAAQPEACELVMNELDLAIQALGGQALETLDAAELRVAEWEGPAADNFGDALMDWQTAVRLQPEILTSMKAVIGAHQEVIRQAQDSLLDILRDARDTLDSWEYDDGGSSSGLVLTIAGLAAVTVGALITGGSSLAATLILAGGLAQGAGAMISAREVTIGGEYPWDIWDSMMRAFDALLEDVAGEEEELDLALGRVLGYLNGPDGDDLVPFRPMINHPDYNPDEFAPPSDVPVAPSRP